MSQNDSAEQAPPITPERPSVVTHPSSKNAAKAKKPTQKPSPKPSSAPSKLEYFLPTERITFRRQLDLLRGYAAATNGGQKPVTNREVAAFVEMTESTTSMANAFFTQNGFLTKVGTGGLIPAGEVVAFQRAYQWDQTTAAHKMAPLVARAWFGQALIPRLQMQAIDDDKAIQILAEAAKAEPKYRQNLRILIEYLDAVGLVVREGNQIRLNRSVAETATATEEDAMGTQPAAAAPTVDASAAPLAERGHGVATSFNSSLASGVIQFNIDVRVDLKEMSGWRPDRIAAFFSGIAQVVAAKGALEKNVSGDS